MEEIGNHFFNGVGLLKAKDSLKYLWKKRRVSFCKTISPGKGLDTIVIPISCQCYKTM